MGRHSSPTDPRIQRLERAQQALDSAQTEYDAALDDLLENGSRGAQAAASRITGMNRDTLRRRRLREAEESTAA